MVAPKLPDQRKVKTERKDERVKKEEVETERRKEGKRCYKTEKR